MGRKTNKQLIKEQLEGSLTVERLIEHLKTLPPNAYVGRVGHFGEAHLMDTFDFSFVTRAYVTPRDTWRETYQKDVDMLAISVPDIGPDPD